MASKPRGNPVASDRPTRLICLACGREAPFTDAELIEYIQNGWPRCCGEAMNIARDAQRGEDTSDTAES